MKYRHTYIYIYIIICPHDISWCNLWQLPGSCWMQKCWGGPPSPVISPSCVSCSTLTWRSKKGEKYVNPKLVAITPLEQIISEIDIPSWKLSSILLKVTCSKTQEMPTSLYKTCLKPWHYPSKQGHYWPQSCPNLPELYTAGEFWSPPEFKFRRFSSHVVSTWRIIPFSKWLKTMVKKSPKWDCFPYKRPNWLINGGY